MGKNSQDYPKMSPFFVLQKKKSVSHIGLEQHEGEYKIAGFSVLDELSF